MRRLFDDAPLLRHAEPEPFAGPGTPWYEAYWRGFHHGRSGEPAPMLDFDVDERVLKYSRDGYRLGTIVNWRPKERR